MPGSVHPLLMQDVADSATTVAEVPEAVVETAPVLGDEAIGSALEGQLQEAEAAHEDEQFWRIDRRNPVQDLQRLLAESPEFANKYNADIGRKAQRKYQPEIEKAQAEAQSWKAQLDQSRFEAVVGRMDQDEVQRRLQADPNFATMYHARREVPNVAGRVEQIEWSRAIDDVIENGISAGLPDQTEVAIKKAIADGRYDYEYDPRTGQPVRQLSQQEGLVRLQRDVAQAADYWRQQARQQAAPAPAPQARPVAAQPVEASRPVVGIANPALQQVADMSGGARISGGARPRISITEFRSLPWDEQVGPRGRYTSVNEFKSAIESGEVYREG